jgi:DNA-binding winged helix-turn-helix (wHTH) protein/Tfp pilus assembly protein PilF
MRYRLAEGILLDLPRACLMRGDEELRLKPKAFDTLVHLVEQRGRLVRKQELLDVIWKDVYVTENALVQAIADVRQALGDSPSEPRFIKTVPRRGYMFIAPVEVEAEPLAATTAQGAANATTRQPSWPVADGQRELQTSPEAKERGTPARKRALTIAGVVGFALALSLGALWYVRRPVERSSVKEPEARAALGSEALRQGDYAKAIEHLKAALDENPDNTRMRRQLAQTLLITDQYAEAARLLEAHPVTANDDALLGLIAWASGNYLRAESKFHRVIEFEESGHVVPADSLGQQVETQVGDWLLASFYLSRSDWKRAEEACRKGLRKMSNPDLNPASQRFHYLLGLAARFQGDQKRAEQEMREALRLSERRLRIRALMALAAKADFPLPAEVRGEDQAVQGRFGESFSWNAAMQLPAIEQMIARGDVVQAIAALGGLLARYPRADGAIVRMAKLRLGQLYERRGELEAARQQYERVVQNRGRIFMDEVMPIGTGTVSECLQPAEAALQRLRGK